MTEMDVETIERAIVFRVRRLVDYFLDLTEDR